MKCDKCKKNEATIHMKEMLGGHDLHLCAECADVKDIGKLPLSDEMMSNMLSELTEKIMPMLNGKLESILPEIPLGAKMPQKECICGWDTKKFQKGGRLGCQRCYEVFKEFLNPALSNMHNGTFHIGKKVSIKSENIDMNKIVADIKSLQEELQVAIKKEIYEEAAIIRDKINQIKQDNNINHA